MKAVFVLCLLAFISCQKDIIDIGKCIYKAPKVKELITDAFIAIATKDFSKLWPKIKEALPDLIQIVIGCITEEKNVAEEQPTLEKHTESQCRNICNGLSGTAYNVCMFHCRNT